VELLEAVTVRQGKLTQPARFRGRFKWVQENLDRELAAGGEVKFSAPSGKSPGWKPTVLKADQDTKVLCPPSLLSKDWSPEVGTNEDGSAEIEALLGDISAFDYPKPTSLVQYLVRMVTASRLDAVVLDFFAGSGTTGHAVAVLNAADSGSRQAILVTNNENDICVKVTHARMNAVLTGDWANGPHDPLPGALRYYRCHFVPVSRNRDVMLRRLAGHASDLIAIRENTHTTIEAKKGQYTVLSGGGRTTVVWCNWNTEGLDDVLASHATDDAALYLFSFSDNPDPDIVNEYPDWRVESLPEPIRAALQRAHRRSSAR
jgi:adenine-specific DNA-methyltransferase